LTSKGALVATAAQAHRDTASARQAGGRHPREIDGQDANLELIGMSKTSALLFVGIAIFTR
jgi:hypothetical protein